MPSSHRIHLIDASPYIFRAYFSVPTSITDTEGNEANAVHGFASFLLKYIAEEQPTHVGVAFDESLTTSFRNEIYPAYKAQRELPPPALEAQLKACGEMARAFGCATYVDERYEADDLIATLSAGLVPKGHDVVVVTPDKDLAQLVEQRVELFDYAQGERYDAQAVKAKFGVTPTQIPDYLGLAGDAVDNIPGVRGVGKKTAVALLAAFTGLEELYADLDRVADLEIRGARSVAAKLLDQRDSAFLSRELATVARDAPARAQISELRFEGADRVLVEAVFERLGFGRLRERITRWKEASHGAL